MTQRDSDSQLARPADPVSLVYVIIPADIAQFALVRGIAASMAVLLDFDVDSMTDLRVAVDSINRAMVEFAEPQEQIHINFTADDDAISIAAAIPVKDNAPIDEYSQSWLISQNAETDVDAQIIDVQGELMLQLTLDVECAR